MIKGRLQGVNKVLVAAIVVAIAAGLTVISSFGAGLPVALLGETSIDAPVAADSNGKTTICALDGGGAHDIKTVTSALSLSSYIVFVML